MLSIQRVWAGIAAISCLLAVLVPRDGLFAQAVPVYRPLDLVIVALAVLAGAAAALALAPVERTAGPNDNLDPLGALAIASGVLGVLLMIVLMLVSPRLLFYLVREDSPAEILQALLLFCGAIAAAYACLSRGPNQRLRVPYCGLLAALLLLIGLEEVSWFQRILGIETPDWLAQINVQGETNLHNLATAASEYVYYLGAIVLLVLSRTLRAAGNPALDQLVPGLSVLAIGTMSAGLNYEMWPHALAVLGFALALSFAATLLWTSIKNGLKRRAQWLGIVIAITILAQVALVFAGDRLFRPYDNDEVRETLIALGLALYAWQLAVGAHRQRLSLTAGEA